jgi:hypothetical protein
LLSHQRKIEKKVSGDSSENGICGCGSPARCCQPAVAGGFVHADLRSFSPNPSGFVYLEFCWARPPLLTAFPFPSTLGEVTLHPLSQASMFIYSSRGKWAFPLSCGVFLPLPQQLLQAFPHLVAGHVPQLLPSPANLFIYSSVRDCPSPPLQLSGHPALFATCLFCCYCLLFSFFFFFFPWVAVGLSRGLCWSASSQAVWELVSPFSHFVPCI